MIGEEYRNIVRMAKTMRTMMDRMIEVAEELAEQAEHMERSCRPAETQVAALPPDVLDLRDPAIWRAQ